MRRFCDTHSVPYKSVGKLIVATDDNEITRLDAIESNARQNGVPGLRRLGTHEIGEIEPEVVGVAALHSPTTSIVDFRVAAERLAAMLGDAGHSIRTNAFAERINVRPLGATVVVDGDELHYDHVIVCAGLVGTTHLASSALGNAQLDLRIVPFRGEFYSLNGPSRSLVNGLVYPVPDARYPFLASKIRPAAGG